MTQYPMLNKYPNVPQDFKNMVVNPYWGHEGGNPESPIWLVSLEWGGGLASEKPLGPCHGNKWSEPEFERWDVEKIEEQIKKSGVYRSYVWFLTELITGESAKEKDPIGLEKQYEFFCPGRYGLLINTFPISMKGRGNKNDRANQAWQNDKVVKLKEGDEPSDYVTLAEWTTIPTFNDYLEWTAEFRHKNSVFSTLRRKYAPYVIYCGGNTDWKNVELAWTDDKDSSGKLEWKPLSIPSSERKLHLDIRWLENGEDKNKTLLVIGPFYAGLGFALDKQSRGFAVAEIIRKWISEADFDTTDWLKVNKFLPSTFKK
ncbi:MAG: hypothetical protein LUC43_06375 [Burkholderiales bacterium]|nr:hypothetical protein [Burkholderiales bacterium]